MWVRFKWQKRQFVRWLPRSWSFGLAGIGMLACAQIIGVDDSNVQGACVDDSQCAPGFGCLIGHCRSGCAADGDCSPGSRCLRGIGASVCLPSEEGCGSGCPEGTSCTANVCRTECASAAECAGGQECRAGFCIGADTTHDTSPQPVSSAGSGGSAHAGEPGMGGSGGSGGSTGGTTGGGPDTGGEPGAGGEGGAEPIGEPALGGRCLEAAKQVCVGAAQKQRLLCSDGRWADPGSCTEGQNCDQSSGDCAAIVAVCVGKNPAQQVCAANDQIVRCGPDLVSTEPVTSCAGKCVALEQGAQCAPESCGDGKQVPPEDCDDGDKDDTDECTSACHTATCGDGATWANHEECDDGNDADTDGCIACKKAVCGDGKVQSGVEECDDKNASDTDGCIACKKAVCGDGKIQSGVEECDDKNSTETDACVACKKAVCGDGKVQSGVEECDDKNSSKSDACIQCVKATCGDGYVRQDTEACDPADSATPHNCARSCEVSTWALWHMPQINTYDTSVSGIVTDTVTKLVWQRSVPPGSYAQSGAKAYCADLALAGFDDWRLPTRIELISIMRSSTWNPSIDSAAFPSTPAANFWTSSDAVVFPSTAWSIDFQFANVVARDVTTASRVRCVR